VRGVDTQHACPRRYATAVSCPISRIVFAAAPTSNSTMPIIIMVPLMIGAGYAGRVLVGPNRWACAVVSFLVKSGAALSTTSFGSILSWSASNGR
jgi:hypothetical protein